ncbi:carbon storage regulator [compost metagenome]
MSNLVLSRKGGQGVEFHDTATGFKSGLTVLRVTGGDVRMHFDGGQPFVLHIGQYAPMVGMDLEVSVIGLAKGQAKLGFNAPQSVKIMRTEIVNREP